MEKSLIKSPSATPSELTAAPAGSIVVVGVTKTGPLVIVFDEVEDMLLEAVLEAVLEVVLEAILEREFEGPANISVPPAKRSLDVSAEMASPSSVMAGAPGTIFVLSRTRFPGFTTKTSVLIVMVA